MALLSSQLVVTVLFFVPLTVPLQKIPHFAAFQSSTLTCKCASRDDVWPRVTWPQNTSASVSITDLRISFAIFSRVTKKLLRNGTPFPLTDAMRLKLSWLSHFPKDAPFWEFYLESNICHGFWTSFSLIHASLGASHGCFLVFSLLILQPVTWKPIKENLEGHFIEMHHE